MLERALEQARSGNDHHLAGRVRIILTAIKEERDGVDEMVEDELEGIEGEHPLIDAIEPLKRWIENEEYHDGAEPAMEHLIQRSKPRKKTVGKMSLYFLLSVCSVSVFL